MENANPYSPPPEEKSTLSARERQEQAVLQFYWDHRDRAPTFTGFSRRFAKIWLIRLFMFGVIGLCAIVSRDLWYASMFLGGVVLGRTLGDISSIRTTRSFWSLTQQIINWPEIERRLERGI